MLMTLSAHYQGEVYIARVQSNILFFFLNKMLYCTFAIYTLPDDVLRGARKYLETS